MARRRAAAKRRYFPKNAVRGIERSQRDAIRALSELRSSDPEAYDRRTERADRSGLENTLRDVANAADRGLRKGTEYLQKTIERNRSTEQKMGLAPDPSKASKEILEIVANTPSGTYMAGAAGVEAINKAVPGDAKVLPGGEGYGRGKKLVKDFKDTSALGAAAQGKFGEAAKRAQERPITTALELSGVKAVIGRSAGAAARSGVAGRRVKGAASLNRPNLKLYRPEESRRGPEIERRYSKDLINKAAQVAMERRTQKGSRVRRHGPNKGTQRRPGRDPHVDYGSRLVPSTSATLARPAPPVRQRLKRRIDTRIFSQQRAVEVRTRRAGKDARQAMKENGPEAQALRDAARADAIRRELANRRQMVTGKERKEIRELMALPDDRLLDVVEASAKPRDVKLAAIEVPDAEIPRFASRKAAEFAGDLNRQLLGREFGIPIGKTGTAASRSTALRIAARRNEARGTDLVPFRKGEKQWVLVPREVADRLSQHSKVDESRFGPESTFDRITGNFKDVVLTSASPSRWLGGNIADIGMRTVFAGLTPLDILRGAKITGYERKMGLQGEQSAAATTGGGLYSAADALSATGRPISRANIPRQAWRGWKRAVFTLEHSIEVLPQYGAKGKAFRQEGASRLVKADGEQKGALKRLLKLSDEQMENYARGIATDRAKEARIQFLTEDVIGRWGKVSPGMRRTLSLAPFAQWLGAATRYTLVTLPGKHPIKTGILAGISEMTEAERQRLGLSYFLPDEERAPDYQMGMLPLEVGQNKYGPVTEGIRTSRMTSLGTAAEMPWGLPDFLLPQVSGAFNALQGQSFTGEPLVYPEWYPPEQRGLPMSKTDRLPVALGAQLETMIPFASAFRRALLDQGRPAEPSSTILTPETRRRLNYDTGKWEEREGTPMGGLGEWAMPFAPKSRIYTQGAGRDIERSQITTQTLKEWQDRRKKGATSDLYAPDNEPDDHDLYAPNQSPRKDRRDLYSP